MLTPQQIQMLKLVQKKIQIMASTFGKYDEIKRGIESKRKVR
jgi:hypothetical protein